MAKLVKIEFTKTYASYEGAIRAVEKIKRLNENDDLRYMIVPTQELTTRPRYGVLFIGENALQADVHFLFNVTF